MIDMEKIEKALEAMHLDDILELAEHLVGRASWFNEWIDSEYDEDPERLRADAIDHIIYTLKFPSKIFEKVK